MANWTPAGFIGQMFKATAAHVPPPNMPSPLLWGNPETVQSRLGDTVQNLQCTPRLIDMAYPFGPAETVECFRTFYGPTHKAFATLDEAGQAALFQDLTRLWTENNRANDGTTRVASEYLEVTATK
jgi:hypothetical protein